jgi:3-oxoacyl-[acyl-carrier protein] reductase
MDKEFAGKVALVTGASKGIGAGIAKAFGQAGAHVAVAYARDRDGAERVAAEIEAAGGRAMTVQCNLAQTADIEAMVAKTVMTFGPVQILATMPGRSSTGRCRRSPSRTTTAFSTPMFSAS